MEYILVKNKETIILGPVPWNVYRFTMELRSEGIAAVLPNTIGEYPLHITDNYSIYRVQNSILPSIDEPYEVLVGPFYTYTQEVAISTYTKKYNEIDTIKQTILNKLASIRYNKEVSGIDILVNNTMLHIPTDRDFRTSLVSLVTHNTSDSVNWKIGGTWINIQVVDLIEILSSINTYVQNCFDEENTLATEVRNCTSLDELYNYKYIFGIR